MRNRTWSLVGAGLSLALVVAGCSVPERQVAQSDGAPQSASQRCETGADRIAERLQLFLADLPQVTPEDFLALDEIEGIAEFRADIAQIISETSDERSTLCNLDGLQELVGQRLSDVEREGVLAEFLVATIRDGRQLATADLAVEPGDDVAEVLALLDDGSSLTFAPGEYRLDRPLVVQRSVTFLGESVATTTLSSSAADAAIIVVGRGELIIRDLAVEHRGATVASVVLAFGRRVDLGRVRVSGGVAGDDGSSGNGVVLTDETFGGAGPEPGERPQSVIVSAVLSDNEGAGLAVNGAVLPAVEDSEISGNAVCGVCYFGAAGGELRNSTLRDNGFGVQISDSASPVVNGNLISTSVTAGIVAVGTASPTLEANTVELAGEVGIAVQDSAAARLVGNELRSNPLGISLSSDGDVHVDDNTLTGGEVGIQIDGSAVPQVSNNRISETTAAGIGISGRAAPTLADNEIEVGDGVGVIADGDSSATLDGLTVIGGAVAVAYAGNSTGSLVRGSFDGPQIGLQIDETAAPDISLVEILSPESAGIVVRADAAPTVSDVRIVDSGEVGFALADAADATLVDLVVIGGVTGGSIIGESTARVEGSRFERLEVGIQIGERASPVIEANEFIGMGSAALVYVADGAGTAEANVIRDAGLVGIQLGERSRPELIANVLFAARPDDDDDASVGPGADREAGEESLDDATVGILYADEAAGKATRNRIIGYVIGIQVGGDSAPDLVENDIDGGVLVGVGVLFRDRASGTVVANTTAAHAVGFQISDDATPYLESNVVISARNVAFLVQGAADPVLVGNTCPNELAGIGLLDGTDPQRTDNDCVEVAGQ